jgi:hypothetical protein
MARRLGLQSSLRLRGSWTLNVGDRDRPRTRVALGCCVLVPTLRVGTPILTLRVTCVEAAYIQSTRSIGTRGSARTNNAGKRDRLLTRDALGCCVLVFTLRVGTPVLTLRVTCVAAAYIQSTTTIRWT